MPKSKEEIRESLRKKLREKKGVKICLVMIVKNEAKNMKRLLDSLQFVIHCVCITDTGSTDETVSVTQEWGRQHNIPITFYYEPFQNFGLNRTHSFLNAKKAYPDASYALLSDADFIWEIESFDPSKLTEDGYKIVQYLGDLRYINIRLISLKADWVCRGVTHEVWEAVDKKKQFQETTLSGIAIRDIGDGGCKSDKYTRDERLLRGALSSPKLDIGLRRRYTFYLAQTLKDSSNFREAILCYTQRVNLQGWEEEVFYSLYQIGHCAEKLKDFNLAKEKYLEAYKHTPSRAEPLYNFTRLHREQSECQLAYQYATLGKTIPYPRSDALFVQYDCYKYLFDYELSIVAFHIPGKKKEGLEALQRVLSRNDISETIKETCQKNLTYYQ